MWQIQFLNCFKEFICLYSSGTRAHNCGSRLFKIPGHNSLFYFFVIQTLLGSLDYMVWFFFYSKFPLLEEQAIFISHVSVMSVWIFLWWFQISLLSTSSASKLLVLSINTTPRDFSCNLIIMLLVFLDYCTVTKLRFFYRFE